MAISLTSRFLSSTSGDSGGDSDNDKDDPSLLLSQEWVPPNRPLSGDQGASIMSMDEDDEDDALLFVVQDEDTEEDIQRKLEEALARQERREEQALERALEVEALVEQQAATATSSSPPVDWLATRRAALGARLESSAQAPVEIKPHTLLTSDEITSLLEHYQAKNIVIIRDDPNKSRMGGADGMILCSCQDATSFHISSITRALIDHLKLRRLDEVGVLGAQMTSKSRSAYTSTNWTVVDCQNYIVHIFDERTRRALNLEDLWNGKDPLWTLDLSQEDQVDEYVSRHPVPADYPRLSTTSNFSSSSWSISKLEKNPFAPYGSDNKEGDSSTRRGGRSKRRPRRSSTRTQEGFA